MDEKTKEELALISIEAIKIVSDFGLQKYVNNLCAVAEKIISRKFKVVLLGCYKRGRSTFVNALLGERICPTKCMPCMPYTTIFNYGENKNAKITFKNYIPKINEHISEYIKSHLKTQGLRNVPPLEIDIERIAEYVDVKYADYDIYNLLNEYPCDDIEIDYPADILKDGIEIVDLYSLGETAFHFRKTNEMCESADAIIFMVDSVCACSQNDMDILEYHLFPMGFNDILFVANRIDLIKHECDKKMIKDFISHEISKYTKHEVSCVSALKALEGKTGMEIYEDETLLTDQEREKALNDSGIVQFENLFKDYVSNKRNLKLMRCARELNSIIKKQILYNEIPQMRGDLGFNNSGKFRECESRLNGLALRIDEILFKMIETY